MHKIFTRFSPETRAKLAALEWTIKTSMGLGAPSPTDDVPWPRCNCPLGWAIFFETGEWYSFPPSDKVSAALVGDVYEEVAYEAARFITEYNTMNVRELIGAAE